MPIKHQSNCYRNIGGVQYENFCDLIQEEGDQQDLINAAKQKYSRVRKIKHPDGYYQLFVGPKKPYKADIANLGRNKVNKTFYYNKPTELHKEIQKHLSSKGWDLVDTSDPNIWLVTLGRGPIGSITISETKTPVPSL